MLSPCHLPASAHLRAFVHAAPPACHAPVPSQESLKDECRGHRPDESWAPALDGELGRTQQRRAGRQRSREGRSREPGIPHSPVRLEPRRPGLSPTSHSPRPPSQAEDRAAEGSGEETRTWILAVPISFEPLFQQFLPGSPPHLSLLVNPVDYRLSGPNLSASPWRRNHPCSPTSDLSLR